MILFIMAKLDSLDDFFEFNCSTFGLSNSSLYASKTAFIWLIASNTRSLLPNLKTGKGIFFLLYSRFINFAYMSSMGLLLFDDTRTVCPLKKVDINRLIILCVLPVPG